MVRSVVLIGIGMLSLTGCGGPDSANELPPEVAFDALATAYVGTEARLAARSNTAFVEPFIEGMPTQGDATYTGNMTASLETAGGDTVLYGEAVIVADFAAGTMSGSATDFVGQDRTGTIDTYDGSIGLTDGKIGVLRPNDFRIDYSGILTGNDEAIGLSGTIDGDFKGDPIRGLLGYDADPLAVVDGIIVNGEVGLAVEGQ